MRKALIFLILFFFTLLIWFGWGWYKTNVVCCPETVVYGPLVFDCSSSAVITSETWPDKKAELLVGRSPGKKLLIAVPMFTGEDESVALGRAKEVMALFKPELADEDMVAATRDGGDCESTKTALLHGAVFKWVTRNADVIEHLDHTVVYYKFDSTEEIVTESSAAYFDELAKVLIETKDQIILTGHTDETGTDEYNEKLGLERAIEFKNHLISIGVDSTQISVQSKGKSMPIADNSTDEGRQENRRVEIHIIDNQ